MMKVSAALSLSPLQKSLVKAMTTNILLITNKEDVTVDFVVRELKAREIPYYRLNTEDIPERTSVDFNVSEDKFLLIDNHNRSLFSLKDFQSVYYRRPVISNLNHIGDINHQERSFLSRELQYLFEGMYRILGDAFWLNSVFKIREAENKIHQLQRAKKIGFTIPRALISNISSSITSFIAANDDNCILKPIKSGAIGGDNSRSIIFTSQLKHSVADQPSRFKSFPSYIQEHVTKKSDIRCTVVGNKIFAAEIHSQDRNDAKVDWRKSAVPLKHEAHELPKEIEQYCLSLTQSFGLNYSAIDLILDREGNYIFLELNPNGQWAWIENRLALPISHSIVELLANKGHSNGQH